MMLFSCEMCDSAAVFTEENRSGRKGAGFNRTVTRSR
jgi:hypothetical protein